MELICFKKEKLSALEFTKNYHTEGRIYAIASICMSARIIVSSFFTAIDSNREDSERSNSFGQVIGQSIALILTIVILCKHTAAKTAAESNDLTKRADGGYDSATNWGLCSTIMGCIFLPLGAIGLAVLAIVLVADRDSDFGVYVAIFFCSLGAIAHFVFWLFAIDLTIKGYRNKKAFRELLAGCRTGGQLDLVARPQ